MDKKVLRSISEQPRKEVSHCSHYAFLRADDGSSVDVRDYDLESLFLDDSDGEDDDFLL